MAKSSFNAQAVKPHSSKHNSRDESPSYLLDNFCTKNEYIFFNDYKLEKVKKINLYQNFHNQKMQQIQKKNIIQEAIINIEMHHTSSDILKLIQDLEITLTNDRIRRFNILKEKGKNPNPVEPVKFNLHEIAIHKDEGVFIKSDLDISELDYDSKNLNWFDKEGNDVTLQLEVFRPGKDIFFNKENNQWYKDRKFKKEFDVSKVQIKYNYHAHIIYDNFNNDIAKSARLNNAEYSAVQSITAVSLSMERGIKKSISGNQRMTHQQRKQMSDAMEKVKKEAVEKLNSQNATIQELKQANAELKAELQTAKAKRPEHAQLEQLNKELTIKLKNKDLTIEEMNIKFEELKNKLLREKNEALESVKSTIISHEEEKTAYEQSIEDLKIKIMEKDDLIFGMKVNYGKLEKEKINYIERNESLEKEKEHLEAVVSLKDLEIIDLISLNEMKPKEVEKIVEVPVIKEVVKIERVEVEKIVEVKVENPINTQLQENVSEYRRMLRETTDTKNGQINTLQEEIEELKDKNKTLNHKIVKAINSISEALNIPKDLNFTFFDSVISRFKALQEQIRGLSIKDTTSEEKINPRASDDALNKILKQYEEAKHSEEDISEAMKEFKRRDNYR